MRGEIIFLNFGWQHSQTKKQKLFMVSMVQDMEQI